MAVDPVWSLTVALVWAAVASAAHVRERYIVDCHPESHPSAEACRERGCRWVPKSHAKAPWCEFSTEQQRFAGYNLRDVNTVRAGTVIGKLHRRTTPTLYGNDLSQAHLSIEQITDRILRIVISNESDFQTTGSKPLYPQVDAFLEVHHSQARSVVQPLYHVRLDKSPFGFSVVRRSTQATLLDSRMIPGLTLSEQFYQLSYKLPSYFLYGMGEHSHATLRRDFDWTKWSMFAYDPDAGDEHWNSYGVHPFYVCVEDDVPGNAHGVLFLNSHAMDVTLQPNPPIITFRAIGGPLELLVFMGPTPNEVIQQYTSVIGRPFLPPYWALGFQMSRYGVTDLLELQRVYSRNREAEIPQDVQYLDVDYMQQKRGFTYDTERFSQLPEFADTLHHDRVKLAIVVQPGILSRVPTGPNATFRYRPLELGRRMNIFVKDRATGRPLEGSNWPGPVFWPDFTHRQAPAYWSSLLKTFHQQVPFDAVWLDMNEPMNFADGSVDGCSRSKYNRPPYNPLPYPHITDKTLCMDSEQALGLHYTVHNLYGYFSAKATYQALTELFPGRRPFVLSRSTFVGSGRYTSHWTANSASNWSDLRKSIISMLDFQLFGIPMVGADVCGFRDSADEELCLRWTQLGAFYPLSRNHNSDESTVDQDPAAWPKSTTTSMLIVLMTRYAFLPYLYTLMYQASAEGSTVVRPLFFEFPSDRPARIVDDQFLWGRSLMVVPVVTPLTVERFAYFPHGRWYNMSSMEEVNLSDHRNRNQSVYIGRDSVGLFIRGGSIVPYQEPAKNTYLSRQNPMGIIVALDERSYAHGSLFVDDGQSIDSITLFNFGLYKFEAWSKTEGAHVIGRVRMVATNCEFSLNCQLNHVQVLGLVSKPKQVTVDGRNVSSDQITFTVNNRSMHVHQLELLFNCDHKTHTIEWIQDTQPTYRFRYFTED